MRSKLAALYSLEQLAGGTTAVHRLHPMAKLSVTFVYLLCVLSFGRYDLLNLPPFLFYPVLMTAAADVPAGMILRRTAAALPFCLMAGISNVLLDRAPLWQFCGLSVSAGAVSLLTLLFRTLLCVGAVLILTAVTPFHQLTGQLRRLGVPDLFVTLLEMVWRYAGVLAEEAVSMVTAYRLRGNGAQWPTAAQFGPFAGQLLLRSAARAERVYHAMQCRLYGSAAYRADRIPWRGADTLFVLLCGGSSVLFRLLPEAGRGLLW